MSEQQGFIRWEPSLVLNGERVVLTLEEVRDVLAINKGAVPVTAIGQGYSSEYRRRLEQGAPTT